MGDGNAGSGRPSRRPGPPKAKVDVRKRVERLMQDTGIPRPLAFQVAAGALTLNDALQRLAMRDKVDGLIRRHDLPRALATQIAKGQADLDAALAKRRLKTYLDEHMQDSILVRARDANRPVVLLGHGDVQLKGQVLAVDKYEFDFQPDKGDAVRLHKVHVRLGAWANEFVKVRSQTRLDADHTRPAEPIFRPQARYGCSDRRLFRYMEEGSRIAVTVLEGIQFTGTIEWMSRWEFSLKLSRGVSVVVFRHALANVREA